MEDYTNESNFTFTEIPDEVLAQWAEEYQAEEEAKELEYQQRMNDYLDWEMEQEMSY